MRLLIGREGEGGSTVNSSARKGLLPFVVNQNGLMAAYEFSALKDQRVTSFPH